MDKFIFFLNKKRILLGIFLVLLMVISAIVSYYSTMAIHDDIVQTKIERIQKERLD